jgi:hypothetical protein
MADGQKYAGTSFPKKYGVLVFVRNILYIGKITAASESSTQHRGRRAQQSTSKKKNPP